MPRIPFATQYYALQSEPALSEDLLNLYVEQVPEEGRSGIIVKSTPGLDSFVTLGIGPSYALAELVTNVFYAVSGESDGLHAFRVTLVSGTTTVVDLGNIGAAPPAPVFGNAANLPITIAIGVLAVVVVNPPNAYQCLHTDTAIVQIPGSSGFPSAQSVAYLDGRFVFSFDNQLFSTGLLDAGTYSALDFTYADQVPTTIERVVTHAGELWMMGQGGNVVYYDAGTVNFPFAPRSGAVIPEGCINAATIVELDGSLFWLGIDGVGYRSQGYRAVRVTNNAVEEWMQYHGDYQNVDAFGYTQSGHKFWVLNFFLDGANPAATFAYDTITKKWHRRASSADGTGVYRAVWATQNGVVPLFGDRTTGQIFVADLRAGLDGGLYPLRWAVQPPVYPDAKRGYLNRVEIELDVNAPVTNKTVVLDYSDDNGVTWSTARTLMPSTKNRVFTTRLGSFRQRVLRWKFYDRAAIYGVDAEIDVGKT